MPVMVPCSVPGPARHRVQPGTLGLGPQCAFSKHLAGAYQGGYEIASIAAILNAGYAVAATDGRRASAT